MYQIPNSHLSLSDVPGLDADLDEIIVFAHTFDAYEYHGSFEAAAEIANRHASDTLTDLRTCLFFEIRRWRHFGQDPDPEADRYIRGLVAEIRRRVSDG